MLDISQVTNMLKSLGVASSTATNAAQRTAQGNAAKDPLAFLQELQSTLAALSAESSSVTTPTTTAPITVKPEYQSTVNIEKTASTATSTAESTADSSAVKAPFNNFEEFRDWESGLGDTFAQDYKAPDYIHMMGLSLGGGDEDAFKRYVFFKNNPAFAVDYENIRDGKLSSFPTDGSTLVKSDLSAMPAETAEFFKQNPDQLRMAEGFNMDPTLYKMRMDGTVDIPADTNATEWLMQNKWTSDGIVANNNRVTNAQRDFIGLDGQGAGTYKLAKYDLATGNLIDLDGKAYDPVTGKAAA